MQSNYNIVLGSKSPRRKELLAGLGFHFTIKTKETDESFPSDLNTDLVAEHIAKKKADALVMYLTKNELLICSDTVVIIEDEILGKPKSEKEAIEMLQKLSGKTHKVTTGVALFSSQKKHSFSVTT